MKKSFHDEIRNNKVKSVILLISVLLFFIALGYVISFAFSPDYFFLIMIIAIVFSLIYTLTTYYNSHKIALASVKAIKADSTKFRHLHDVVDGLAIGSGIPKPKVYLMENSQINAFASGRNPQNAVVCITTGALEKLNNSELEGVLAHEISHIKNYDMKFMTIIAIVVGAIAIFAQIFLRSLWFGGGRSRNNNSGAAGAIFMLIGIAFAILAPLIVSLIQLAMSRKREFLADASAAQVTRYPQGLANALRKIKTEKPNDKERQRTKKQVSNVLAPLFISDPFKKKVKNAFSTHPTLDERIKRLEGM